MLDFSEVFQYLWPDMYNVYVYYIKHFKQFNCGDDYNDYTDFVVTSVMITNIELSIREFSSIVTMKL